MTGGVQRGEWSDLDEGALLDRLVQEGLGDVHGYDDVPDGRYDSHVHPFDKVLHCVRGGVVFTTPEGALALGPGDRMLLPAGTPHSAVVGPDGVRLVEGHRGPAPGRAAG